MADPISDLIDYLSGGAQDATAQVPAVAGNALANIVGYSPKDAENHPLNQALPDHLQLDANELAALDQATQQYRGLSPQAISNGITRLPPTVDPMTAAIASILGGGNSSGGLASQLVPSDVHNPPQTPAEKKAYDLVGSILASPQQQQVAGWPTADPSQATISSQDMPVVSTAPPTSMLSASPVSPQTTGLNTPAIPGYTNGVPTLQQGDPLASLLVGLITGGKGGLGGIAYSASAAQQYQNMQGEHAALLAQKLYTGSPAEGIQKQQRAFIQARINNDVSSFMKALTSGQIPNDQVDSAWQQLRMKYLPAGEDIGPSPSTVTQYAAEAQSPAFRHAKLADAIQNDDENEIDKAVAAGLLNGDPGAEQVAQYFMHRRQINVQNINKQLMVGSRRIDQDRVQEQQLLESIARGSGDYAMNGNVLHKSPQYSDALSMLDQYYAKRKSEFFDSAGQNLGQRFINDYDVANAGKSKQNFSSFVSDLRQRTGRRASAPATQFGPTYIESPLGSRPVPSANLTPEQKSKAAAPEYNVDDPHTLHQMQDYANRKGVAIAGNSGGNLAWITPDTIRR